MGGTQSTRKITLVNDDKAGVIKLSESLANRLRGQIEGQNELTTSVSDTQNIDKPLDSIPPQSVSASCSCRMPVASVGEGSTSSGFTPVLAPSPTPTPPQYVPATSSFSQPVQPPIVQSVLPSSDNAASGFRSPDINKARVDEPPQKPAFGGSIPPWALYAEEAQILVNKLKEEKEVEIAEIEEQWKSKLEEREKEFVDMTKLTQDHIDTSLKEVEALFMKVSCTPVCQDHQLHVMKCYQDHPRQSLSCAKEVENFSRCVDLSRLQAVMKEKAS